MQELDALLRENEYPGRGIVLGRSEDGQSAVAAYFIMGRSENSRNRVFVEKDGGILTRAFDEAKMTDPSLIIYAPVRVLGDRTIVTNGDQTDTICEYLKKGFTFEAALRTRCFEPDAPNYTPRVSGLILREKGRLSYKLSILKSDAGDPGCPLRFFFEYAAPKPGTGHFLHTYRGDGSPLPSFEGEPVRVALRGSVDETADLIWNSLHPANKVSLFVRFIDLATGRADTRIINKNR